MDPGILKGLNINSRISKQIISKSPTVDETPIRTFVWQSTFILNKIFYATKHYIKKKKKIKLLIKKIK